MKILVKQIESLPSAVLEVVVEDKDGSSTTHRVSVSEDYYKKLAAGAATPEELVRKSFDFLLEREPKESILREFDLSVISQYFPEYEDKIK